MRTWNLKDDTQRFAKRMLALLAICIFFVSLGVERTTLTIKPEDILRAKTTIYVNQPFPGPGINETSKIIRL